MIVFQGKVVANAKDYPEVAKLTKVVTDKLDRKLRSLTCPNHPTHNHQVILNFSNQPGVGIEIMNSCCSSFPAFLGKKINAALSEK